MEATIVYWGYILFIYPRLGFCKLHDPAHHVNFGKWLSPPVMERNRVSMQYSTLDQYFLSSSVMQAIFHRRSSCESLFWVPQTSVSSGTLWYGMWTWYAHGWGSWTKLLAIKQKSCLETKRSRGKLLVLERKGQYYKCHSNLKETFGVLYPKPYPLKSHSYPEPWTAYLRKKPCNIAWG